MESVRRLADQAQDSVQTPEVMRRRLQVALRRARDEKGLTQKMAADALDWSPSKIIRIEQGAVAVSSTDLRALLMLYGVEDESEVTALVELARGSRKPSWSEYRDVYSPASLTFFGFEPAARAIFKYEPTFLPGLFQTEEYARALLTGLGLSDERVDRIVSARLARQELLERSVRPRLSFILGEAAISRPIGGDRVMLRQLDRLKELAALPDIKIQVLTFDRGVHPFMGDAFTILEFDDLEDLLYLENAGGDSTYRDEPELIAKYREAFVMLETAASPASQLSKVLDQVSKARFKMNEHSRGVELHSKAPAHT